jgi:sulfate adenylyltransferase subunit 2
LKSHVLSNLRALEAESIFIFREVAAEMARPCLLFSGGKDSTVMLALARKAFAPAPIPFPIMHVDTGLNFPEVLAYRDRWVNDLGLKLIVASVPDAIERGIVQEEPNGSRNRIQTPVLLEAVEQNGFDCLFGGARRDEEKARAKERVFSFRDEFGQWDPKNQRPELWDLYNSRVHKGEHVRVFPISNWTELDVWQYIEREKLAVPSIYYAHRRQVVRRNGYLFIPKDGEKSEEVSVRFRTVGDISCTCPVESVAFDVSSIIKETINSRQTERGATRMDDQTSDASMERRKKEGYF